FGGVAGGDDAIGQDLEGDHASGGPGGVGAFVAVVVLVTAAVDQYGRVRLGEAEQPARVLGIVGRFERIVEETFAVGFEKKAVAVGVFVIGGTAAAEGEDGVFGFPAGA